MDEWKINWKSRLKAIVGVQGVAWVSLYCISFVLTDYDDHSNLAGAARRIKSGQVAAQQMEKSCTGSSLAKSTRIDDLLSRIQSQQQSINGQQSTINRQQGLLNGQQSNTHKCVAYLTQNSAAEFEIKVKLGYLPLPKTSEPAALAAIVAIPNQTINPMSVNVKCTGDLKLFSTTFPNQTRSQMLPIQAPISGNEYHVSLAYPPWLAGDIVIFWATTKRDGDLGSCSVYKQ